MAIAVLDEMAGSGKGTTAGPVHDCSVERKSLV
jgi:hypothetical protein